MARPRPSQSPVLDEPTMLARDLMVELTGVVPTLGGHQVTVCFGGQDAFCDSTLSFVNIPALPETQYIPLSVARQIRGFAAHEAAHLAFTDPGIPIVRRDGTKDALQHTVWNSVEDYMIERFWIEIYPGAIKNFAATESWCCARYLQTLPKNPHMVYDLRQIGAVALTWMRALYFGLGTTASRECLDTLPADHRARVEGWFRQMVVPVETTQECLDVAQDIYDDIMANPLSAHTPPAAQKALSQPSPQQGPAGQQGQPQAGQGSSTPGQAGQGQSSTGQPGQGQTGQGQPGQAPAGQQPQGQNQGQPTQGQPGTNQGQAAGPQPAASGPGAAFGAPVPQSIPGHALRPTTPHPVGFDLPTALHGAGITPSTQPLCAPVVSTPGTGPAGDVLARPSGRARVDALMTGLQDTATQTAAELRRALKTRTRDRWRTGRLDGIIDSRRIAFAASGSLEYHRKKVRGEDIDTAVSILVDCSQSMNGTKLSICQQMGIVLEQAFAGTPVEHEILGFTTADHGDVSSEIKTAQQAHKRRGPGLPVQPTGLYVVRPFGAAHGPALNALGHMDNLPLGGTPTSQGMLLAHDRLAKRKERRHVLIVLTDGKSDDANRTRKIGEAIAACGVTVLGIGINSPQVRSDFAHHVVLSNVRELPALMISTLSGILLGERHKKGMHTAQVRQKRAIG